MGFEDDIFISYAHIDNHPLTEGQEGWISDLHRALQIRLAQLRGETPKIWRDLKLQGNYIEFWKNNKYDRELQLKIVVAFRLYLTD